MVYWAHIPPGGIWARWKIENGKCEPRFPGKGLDFALKTKNSATALAILAAALYAVNIPVSKILLNQVGPTMMAAFLYLGAGAGLWLWGLVTGDREKSSPLTRAELPYTIGMVVLDIAAPILLMLGLKNCGSANASLLNNFEIVATSAIAFFVFREQLSRRLTLAVVLVTLASAILSFEGTGAFRFDTGSVLVLGAACCWGLENNCTRMLSGKSSVQITTIKGIFSGLGSLTVALALGENFPGGAAIGAVLLLGFVAYGLSINFYIRAQASLGAAKTSAWYSIAPFLGVFFGMVFLGERPRIRFYLGLAVMIGATVLMVKDTIGLQHTHAHSHTHTHEHRHGELVHSHEHTHVHTHTHVHGADENRHDHGHKDIPEHDHHHEA